MSNFVRKFTRDDIDYYCIEPVVIAFTSNDLNKPTWDSIRKHLIQNAVDLLNTSLDEVEKDARN